MGHIQDYKVTIHINGPIEGRASNEVFICRENREHLKIATKTSFENVQLSRRPLIKTSRKRCDGSLFKPAESDKLLPEKATCNWKI